MPPELAVKVWHWHKENQLTRERILQLREGSPLGRIFAAGLSNRRHSRDVMKEAIVEVGRQVVADLERYLNTLGTIAAISPLLGLLGTVTGMIKAFTVITTAGVGNPPARRSWAGAESCPPDQAYSSPPVRRGFSRHPRRGDPPHHPREPEVFCAAFRDARTG